MVKDLINISKADFSKATSVAHKTFCELTEKVYPVNIIDLIEKLPNTLLATYEEFANWIKKDVGFVVKRVAKNNDAFTLNRNDEYIIVYNPDITENVVERIRFSIAHEIGHILLNHFDAGDSILMRGGLSETKYKILEDEANKFAQELLAPTFIMNTNRWNIDNVRDIFDVSKEVAKITLENKSKYPWIKAKYPLSTYLNLSSIKFNKRKSSLQKNVRDLVEYKSEHKLRYLIDKPYFHLCNTCFNIERYYGNRTKFCTICGKKTQELFSENDYFIFHETKERLYMAYSELKVDDSGRLNENCPICGNDHVSDNYCSVCGVYIINKCSGIMEENANDTYNVIASCSEASLLGSDRYCPKCGSVSTFYLYNLLDSWDSKKHSDSDYQANYVDITDDDLPF